MAGEKYLVVDASVVVKWQLADEEGAEAAVAMLQDALDGRVVLFAPTLIRCEYANALLVAVRRGRLAEEQAELALGDFLGSPLNVVEDGAVLRRAYSLAKELGRSVYDGIYLALAEHLGIPLYTGDRRLYDTAQQHFSWIRWVEEYASPA